MSERPRYEQPEDRNAEKVIAKEFCSYWGALRKAEYRPYKLDARRYEIDFGCVAATPDGKFTFGPCWFEAKRRRYKFGAYADVFVSFGKVMAAHRLWYVSDLPVYFVVQFDDDYFAYADLCSGANRIIKVGGRNDRGDPMDQEPMVHIPIDQWSRFK